MRKLSIGLMAAGLVWLGAPAVSQADQVIADDLIVQGSICAGLDCVNNESFSFDTLRLKENNLRIGFDDTSTGSFPVNDWQITINDSASGGANKFSIDDISGARTPFTIEAGAPNNSLYVDDGGRIGLGTMTPVVNLHVVTGNTPTLRLEQDGSSGFTPQTWDVAGNEANFFIRDATNGSTLPFRIEPGTASNTLYLDGADDRVGIGTASPDAKLDITSNAAVALKLANTAGGVNLQMDSNDDGSFWNITAAATPTGNFVINNNDGVGTEFSLSATGNLTLEGEIITTNCPTGCGPADFVFEPDYELMPLEKLELYVKEHKHLPNVASAAEVSEKGVRMTHFSMRLLEKIEELTLYTIQQQKTIEDLQVQLKAVETTMAKADQH